MLPANSKAIGASDKGENFKPPYSTLLLSYLTTLGSAALADIDLISYQVLQCWSKKCNSDP